MRPSLPGDGASGRAEAMHHELIAKYRKRLSGGGKGVLARGRRRRAASWLAQHTELPEAVGVLAEALPLCADPGIGAAVRAALERICDPSAVDAACEIWHRTRSPELEALLVGCGWVATSPPELRVLTALKANRPIDLRAGLLVPLLSAAADRDPDIAARARDALEHALEGLGTALGDPRQEVRGSAAKALSRIGDNRLLELALARPDPALRAAVAGALGDLGGVTALDPLIRAYADADARVREAAGRALSHIVGRLPDSKGWRELNLRKAILRQLAAAGAVDALLTAVESSDRGVRMAAVSELGNLGDLRVVVPLVTTLWKRDQPMRQQALAALTKLGWAPGNDSERALLALAAEDWDGVQQFGVSAVGPLAAAFGGFSVGTTEQTCATILRRQLAAALPVVDVDTLRSITELSDCTWPAGHYDTSGEMESTDVSDIRDLARAELARRGQPTERDPGSGGGADR